MQGPLLPTVLSCVLPQFPGWWICLGWGSTALPPTLLPHLHTWIGYSNPFVVPGVSHLPSRAGLEPRVPSPAPAPWSQLSCWNHRNSCRDPCRDCGCPEDLGREMVQSCLPGSHQNAKTNSHTSKERRMEDDPRTQSGAQEKEDARPDTQNDKYPKDAAQVSRIPP